MAEREPESKAKAFLAALLTDWRNSLINLTAANRLLNFKPARTSTVSIEAPAAAPILAALDRGQDWVFRALLTEEEPPGPDGETDRAPAVRAPQSEPADSPAGQVEGLATLADNALAVRKTGKDLFAALRTLLRRTNQEYLDRGIWILHLAVGALTWADVDGTRMTSPLLLVPVRLAATGPKQMPTLAKADEDPVVNPALALKMSEFDVTLPGLDPNATEGIDVAGLLDRVREAVEQHRFWEVDERAVLSYFSFTKETMYRDLLDNEAAVLDSPLIQALGARAGDTVADFLFEAIPDEQVDEHAPAEKTPLVLDADSSQRAAIAAAVAGKSFVMDGPPGTGKSQTISNIIGAALDAGRSVLFVSEKAAALEVVRNRLTDVGLGNYLLELHSHKATRKQVATALGEALAHAPVAPAPMSALDRTEAAKRRTELNDYAIAMNCLRHPLGMSLHQVLGLIAQLAGVPAAPAPGAAPARLTLAVYGEIREASKRLARAWRPAVEGNSFVWREVIERGSLDARLYQATDALQRLRTVSTYNADLAEAFDMHGTDDAVRLADLLAHLAVRPTGVPDAWLMAPSLNPVHATLGRLVGALNAIREAEDAVAGAARVRWHTIPQPDTLPDINARALAALTPPGLALNDLTGQAAAEVADTFAADANMLDLRQRSLSGITAMLGLPPARTFAEAFDTVTVAELAHVSDRPERTWLSRAGLESARAAVLALHTAHQAVGQAVAAVTPIFRPEAIQADAAGLAHRFAHEHTGLKKLFGSAFRADKKTLAALVHPGIDMATAISSLPLVVTWQQAAANLDTTQRTHGPVLGAYYTGAAADLDHVHGPLAHAQTALTYARTDDLSRLADHIAHDATPNPALATLVTDTRDDLLRFQQSLAPEPLRAARPELRQGTLADAAAWLRTHDGPLRHTAAFTEAVSAAAGRTLTYAQAEHLVELRRLADVAHANLTAAADTYVERLGDLYTGATSSPDTIRMAIHWAEVARARGAGDHRPYTPAQVKAAAEAVPTADMHDAARAWESARNALLAAFGPARHADLRAELADFDDAAQLLADLAADSSGKDDWFAYRQARADLAAHGLDVTVTFCINQRLSADQVPAVIERALLQEWADHYLAHDPALRTVRAQDRDALIAEYRRLDKRLIATASSEIITSVNSRRPNTNIGEAAIIRHEAGKKRKHMPVRTLIAKTRHVTQAIKPVFMMSPLSVSQYLPPDMRFDLVIFDEASQVAPADAINCIYRGHALITAGDQKQLPPTNFFNKAASNDEDAEWDEEESPDFESVLDLAKSCGSFESLTLRWHYRSRHQHLIAYSNDAWYGNDLITFPGSIDQGNDVGVGLIPVPDGVYGRGTSRDNPIEAAQVAERVLYHYDTRPHHTLGVVAFSDAQASAIEVALEKARQDRPDLDRHFTDDRLDGFFIKNLESVQGDERDVIIFSIGYGRDENGKMSNNFGPINKPGGWRRLNVAVTRARYRNEIVTSVLAGDITATKTDGGVHHLRRYLDFAARGIPALALDLTDSLGPTESPFEDSVYTTVRGWGYDVVPQVGAAGYRIDLAICHPEHPGAFALGIECDGYMYHSSRVARDRDRLREQVLRGLGWNLHRIWGTAWYRSRAAEEARLRAAIEHAINTPVSGLVPGHAGDLIERPAVETAAVRIPDRPDWATPYVKARVTELSRWTDPGASGSHLAMITGIEEVAAAEGPVHIDVLAQRLRDAWGIGRVGSRIRHNITLAIKQAKVIRSGDFVDVHRDGTPPTVRTPADGVNRTIEQITDAELEQALTGLVRTAGSISADELSVAIARLYGWQRRGRDIAARLDDLIQRQIERGALSGDMHLLTVHA